MNLHECPAPADLPAACYGLLGVLWCAIPCYASGPLRVLHCLYGILAYLGHISVTDVHLANSKSDRIIQNIEPSKSPDLHLTKAVFWARYVRPDLACCFHIACGCFLAFAIHWIRLSGWAWMQSGLFMQRSLVRWASCRTNEMDPK